MCAAVWQPAPGQSAALQCAACAKRPHPASKPAATPPHRTRGLASSSAPGPVPQAGPTKPQQNGVQAALLRASCRGRTKVPTKSARSAGSLTQDARLKHKHRATQFHTPSPHVVHTTGGIKRGAIMAAAVGVTSQPVVRGLLGLCPGWAKGGSRRHAAPSGLSVHSAGTCLQQ